MAKVKPDLVYQIKDNNRRYYHVLCYKLKERNMNDPEDQDSAYVTDWKIQIKSKDGMKFSYTSFFTLDKGIDPIKHFSREIFNGFLNLYDALSNNSHELKKGSDDYKWAMSYEIESIDK